ncbi:hypothetical protein [Streptomyces subrutilus]|uniref:Uncharacterized protein n=1 Tax=Streptomyces subrutilus TaxID=36818 RepID=A0A1E5NXV5_9ACTN|nr:hypothetical protein [Streptomyces subrutilus]OEJ21045.1 hypothetical protein BGK67_34685 [Streptomyces subrutilus]
MTTSTPLPNALHAASRARAIAEIARRRALLQHPAGDALTTIAELLDDVAQEFEAFTPDELDGMTLISSVPFDASFLLSIAEDVVAKNPATGFPAHFGQYVISAVFGTLELPAPLHPVSAQLAAQEANLRAGLQLLHERHLTGAGEQQGAALYLEAAFKLHMKWTRLAAEVAVDNARSCNRPT